MLPSFPLPTPSVPIIPHAETHRDGTPTEDAKMHTALREPLSLLIQSLHLPSVSEQDLSCARDLRGEEETQF